MNIKDKTNRITLRLNDKQFNFVKATADVLGVSPSEFLRMVVNASMVSSKKTISLRRFLGVRTTKPIATISFNTCAYLQLKLDELRKAKIISVYHFIEHLPEDDEAGKKRHIHLYIEPSKLIQTDDLAEHFLEFDAAKPDKPRKCLLFRTSKFGDWYMYAIHDKAYLAAKGQSRRYHYGYDDIVTSDPDELYRAVREIDLSYLTPLREIMQAVDDGLSFSEYLKKGRVPIQQIHAYQKAFDLIAYDGTYRNDACYLEEPEPLQ